MNNNKDNNNNSVGQKLVYIVMIFCFLGLVSVACGDTGSEPVTNDWDMDGDAFDRGDADAFFEWKEKQDSLDQSW